MPELTISELQQKMTAGELTARAILDYYLERIATLDHAGPTLRSVIELNPDAPAIANALDAERRASGPRGPLHGIPVLLKDNIDTADRMQTTAGSLALVGSPAPRDATLVEQLRAAGAVILGKANLSEWANFRSSHSVSGWSSRGGQTRHPYALDRNPCGSSSGSAVAVAADLCAVAVGTETDGSIVCPAQTVGIVGLKPTLGLISRAGIVPIAHSQDTAGPMGRCVADVAALLGPLVAHAPDPRDPATAGAQGHAHPDYTRFLDADGLRGARLGVARNYFGFNPRVDRLMEDCIAVMRHRGAEIVDPANVAVPKELDESENVVLEYEFKADLEGYLVSRGETVAVRSLADIVQFNERHAAEVMPYFGQEVMLASQARGPLTDEAYRKALADELRLARAEGIDATLKQHSLDAIVAPTGGPAWLTDYITGDHYGSGSSSSSAAATAGYPSITVPAGYVWDLPVGISFFAGAYSEPVLLKLAYAFEQATHMRRPPDFRPTLSFSHFS